MLLTPEDHARVAQAVTAAETTTRAEIRCVVMDEASTYPEVPFAWAAIAALVVPIGLQLLGLGTGQWPWLFGGWTAQHLAAGHVAVANALSAYALLQGVLFVAVALVVSIPAVRRTVTPGWLKHARAHQRALDQFNATALHRAGRRNLVLIFASLQDRVAVVLADEGVGTGAPNTVWDGAVSALVAGMRAGKPADGFVAAIDDCARILTSVLPAGAHRRNEHPDSISEVGGQDR